MAPMTSFDLGDRAFNKVLERRVFAAGDVIFEEGQPARALFVVLRGEVDIITKAADRRLILLTTVQTGQTFGEIAFLTESPRTASAITPKGCELMVLSHEVLRKKMESTDPVLRFLITYLASRVVDLSKRVTESANIP
jgi:CRP/FNR family cyclic AMP-dependent transcriptional regulator